MEMVKTELVLVLSLALLASCTGIGWRSAVMDGHRTGVTAPNAGNVSEALGTVSDGVYVSPSGRVFECGSTLAMAHAMIDVQPRMSALKQVVCLSSREMTARRPESELSDFIVDRAMEKTAELTGRKVDVGILNFGGIRVDIPAGPVILDDLVSMLPFRNYLSYVVLDGTDVKALFDFMARKGVQPVGGVRFKVRDGLVESLEIGGQPLDTAATYGVATVDFLLDGGDSLYVARNARELIITDCLLRDAVLPYCRELGSRGEPLEYSMDGRVIVEGNPFER